MKKARRKGGGRAKGKGAPRSVDGYLARVAEPGRRTLAKMRAAIRAAAPAGATEVISYGIPAVRWKEVLVWYAGFAKHCSFFPTRAVIEAFRKELKGYTLSKGTIQFPVDRALPSGLVKKMVRMRVKMVEEKGKRKP